MAETGIVPTQGETANGEHITPKQSGWGPIEIMGVKGRTYNMPCIRNAHPGQPSFNEFWALPEDLKIDLENRQYVRRNVPTHDSNTPHVQYLRTVKAVKPAKRSQGCVSSDSEEEKGHRKPPRKSPATKKARVPAKSAPKANESDYSSAAEDSTQEQDDEWNANASECIKNHFAVVHSLYDETMGMALVKVICFTFGLPHFFLDYQGW